jgi:hypothetical protein
VATPATARRPAVTAATILGTILTHPQLRVDRASFPRPVHRHLARIP